MVTKTMNQDVVAFDAADGIFNKDADLAKRPIFSPLLIRQLGDGIFLALACFFVWQLNVLAPIGR